MLRVGIVGIGFMGMIHYLAWQRVRGAKVAALCSRSAKKLAGDWRGIKGNFGPEGTKMDLSGIATFRSLDELLADEKVDLVDICLPPDQHRPATVAALKAGKHVLGEKPMALTTGECRAMMQAAEKHRRLLFVAHVLPFFPEYAHAYKLISSGKYGRLLGGNFKRIISDPLWLPDFYDPAKVGGPLLDLHVHDAHFIRLLFGMPKQVSSQGRMRGEVVEYFNTQFNFPDADLVVSATSGVIGQQGRSFTHGFEIHLEQATLHYELAVTAEGVRHMPLTVFDQRGKAQVPKLGSGDPLDAFEAELKEVTRSVKDDRSSPILGGELANDAIRLCHRQSESVVRGKPVKV